MKKKEMLPLDFTTPQTAPQIIQKIESANRSTQAVVSRNIDITIRHMMSDMKKQIISVDLSPNISTYALYL
jgi:hypothetical protein